MNRLWKIKVSTHDAGAIVTPFNLLHAVRMFMCFAKQSVGHFNAKQATFYTGMQLEELSEKLEAVATGAITPEAKRKYTEAIAMLDTLAGEFKSGLHQGDVMRADRKLMLDADIDVAWVSVAAVFSTTSDTTGAFACVGKANHDKFPNGVAILDDNGKVVKPAGWKPADLSPFVEQATTD